MVKSNRIQKQQKIQNKKNDNKNGNSCVEKYEILRKNKANERQFRIHSTSGKNYIVTLNRLVHCTCPDCENRVRRCKHINFIMNNILHEKYPRIYYDDRALSILFRNLPRSKTQ